MRPGLTKYQRSESRHTMTWETFMDRVVVLACLAIIVWFATGGAK